MQSLERRIAELEKVGSPCEGPTTIIIRCLSRGDLEEEIQQLHDSKRTQQWKRQPGESEQGLIERASSEVKRAGPGCALLMAGD